MADQKHWWKMHSSILTDDKILSLSPADRWAWVALACHVREHGEAGHLEVDPQNQFLAMIFGCSPSEILPTILRLPNVLISDKPITWPHGHDKPWQCEGIVIVGGTGAKLPGFDPASSRGCDTLEEGRFCNARITLQFKNWNKYAEDNSLERVRKFRANAKCNAYRGEEKRREEKQKRVTPLPPSGEGKKSNLHRPDLFESWYEVYPNKVARGQAERAWTALKPNEELAATMRVTLDRQKVARKEKQLAGFWVPEWKAPATWIRARCWQDEVQGATEKLTPGQRTLRNLQTRRDIVAGRVASDPSGALFQGDFSGECGNLPPGSARSKP